MVTTASAGLAPALYECTLVHVRPGPGVRNTFRYRTYLWLVDLDALPRLPWPLRALARFRTADHAGDPGRTLRRNLDAYLAERGVMAGGRVLMLTHARVLGHVFNPLTVYWCFTAADEVECVVAEVHNTYGGRHRYLLRTDERGRAETAKEFYVSPFYPVAGTYRMRLPLPGRDLLLTIALEGAAPGRPFVAALRGRHRSATAWGLLGAFLRHPWAPLVGAARIRLQGVKLYLRGLRPFPRHGAAVRGESST